LTFKEELAEEEDTEVTNAAAGDDDDDIPGAAVTTEDGEHMGIVMMARATMFRRSSNFIFLKVVSCRRTLYVEDLTIVPLCAENGSLYGTKKMLLSLGG
jgi:hypothetical protein